MGTATGRRKQSVTKPSAARRSVPIVVGLIIAAAVVAVVVSLASGDDDTGVAQSNEAARIPAGSLEQVGPVTTVGDQLPRFDDTVVTDAAVGSAAPTLTASYFDGESVTIDPSDGRPRVVLFVAHWCPHCQAEVITLSEWFGANGPPADVDVVAISTNVDDGAPNYPPSEWFLRERWPMPVLRDSAQNDLATGYGLSGFPYVVVLDGDGTVLHRQAGSMDTTQWEALLTMATAAQT